MSSGDRVKPAAAYKERNPFDISRRSETEVAAEIAQRMAAWKQARGRSYAAPATVPAPKPQQGEPKQQPAEAKQPHIAAPVQPARLPKFGEHVARAPQAGANASERIPLFAMRRAMPPAPSLKQPPAASLAPSAAPEPRVDLLKIDSLQIAAPLLETLIAEHPGTAAAEAAAEALRTQRPQPDPAFEPESTAERQEIAPVARPMPATEERIEAREIDSPGTQTPQPDPAFETDATAERQEIEPVARPMPAADELESPDVDASVAEIREPEPPAAMAAEADDPGVADQRADAPDADALTAEMPETAPAIAAAPAIEPAEHEADAFEARTIAAPLIDAVAEARAAAERESERDPADVRDTDTPGADVLVARQDEAVAPVAPAVERAAREEHPVEPHAMPRLDPMAMEMRAAELAMSERPAEEASEREDPHLDVPKFDAPEIETPSLEQPAMEKRAAEIAVPADLRAKTAAAGSQIRARADRLPRMETHIERRRIDTLRADPWIAGRRPVFPRIELEDWDVPLPVAASRTNRRGSGTGWAISLGMLLLIAGITAPAAIWQQGRQHPSEQEQVAALAPLPATPPQAPATPPATPVQVAPQPSTAPQQEQQQTPSQQAAPQQEQASLQPSAPADVKTSSAPPAAPQPAASAPAPDETTALGEVKSSGELKQAPIVAPPAPKMAAAAAPASRPKSQSEISAGIPADEIANPMVPHPFVPEASPQPTPFRPGAPSGDPTSGAVVGAAAGSVGMPIDGAPATIALKPSLNGQLKPTGQSAANVAPAARQSVVRKPRSQNPQTLDQMFQTLIDTLSEGQPANPATKPLPPGNRR